MIERRKKYPPESEIFKIGISEQRSGGVLDGATPKLHFFVVRRYALHLCEPNHVYRQWCPATIATCQNEGKKYLLIRCYSWYF